MHPKDAEGIANSVDPDQTAPLIWVCTVCPDLSVRKLRIITVVLNIINIDTYGFDSVSKIGGVLFWCHDQQQNADTTNNRMLQKKAFCC